LFLFKKIVAPFFMPLSLCLELLLLGLALLWFSRRQTAGKILVSAATIALLLFSYSPIPNLALRSLEGRYPPLLVRAGSHSGAQGSQAVKWIVVLGGGHTSDPNLPVTSQIGPESLYQVLEGVRLYKAGLGRKLIFSGDSVFDPVPDSQVMARVAEIMGVDPQDIVLESTSRDTLEEARLLKPMVGREPFILVTSASHLPRAMAMFRKLGLAPVAAPAGNLVRQAPRLRIGDFFPDSEALRRVNIALHEYLGLFWARLRGKI
jgi:uncharacterized SAM-binding protein YcdF (DUF218 family)